MKQLRFLLLLLAIIVAQGVRAAFPDGCTVMSQELHLGTNEGIAFDYKDGVYSNISDNPANFNLYKFVSDKHFNLSIPVFESVNVAVFDENGNYIEGKYSYWNDTFPVTLEKNTTYYIGFRFIDSSYDHFESDITLEETSATHNLTHVDGNFNCISGGQVEHWRCECDKYYADEDRNVKLNSPWGDPTGFHNFDFSIGTGEWRCKNCTQVVHSQLNFGDNIINCDGISSYCSIGSSNYSDYHFYHFVVDSECYIEIKNTSENPKAHTIAIFDDRWELLTHGGTEYDESSTTTYGLGEGEYFIGIRGYNYGQPLVDEHFYIGYRCEHNNCTVVSRIAPTHYQAGMQAHKKCNDCGALLDMYDNVFSEDAFIIPAIEHNLIDGKCISCGYNVPELELTKDESTGGYYFEGNVDYELKYHASTGDYSAFRVFVPEHGTLEVRADIIGNVEPYNPHNPVDIIRIIDYEGTGKYLCNTAAIARPGEVPLESYTNDKSVVPGCYYYIFVKNLDVVNSSMKITLTPHSATTVIEPATPTCTEDGWKPLYHCASCGYYFAEDGNYYYSKPDESYFIIPAFGHDFDLTTGECQNDGCEEHIRTLTEGLNEAVDCSNNNMYFFVPEKDGELSVYTSTDNEYVIYFRVMDADLNVIHSDRQKAPSRGGANTLEFNRVSVEKGKKYILSLNSTIYGVDEVDVYIEVKEDVILSDTQDNEVSFPEGENQVTAFKYTATQTKCLNVVVETNATINDYIIMPWSEWMPSDNDDKPMSAPRKVSGQEEVEPLMSKNVIAGTTYAIAFLTTADSNEDATITLTYTEIEYPVVEEGETTIDIAAVNGNRDENPEHYNIFKFVAPKTGVARFYTYGREDTYGVLFSDSFERLTYNDDNDTNSNFDFTWPVEEGETYYLGVRSWGGYSIGEYPLVIKIEGLPEFNGTLELATADGDNVTENDFVETVMKYFPTQDDFSMAFVTNGGVTYKRNSTTSRWGTVILPYELNSNDDVTYYQLSAVGDAKMTFSPVESVPANTPTVYRFNNEASSYQYDASTTEPTLIELPSMPLVDTETDVDGWRIAGFYEQKIYNKETMEISSDEEMAAFLSRVRYISKDKFMTATKSLTIKPYRSVFMYTGENVQMAQSFTLSIEDEGVTTDINAVMTDDGIEEVEAIYDLNGQRKNSIQRGVNIIRTADGKTRKFIKK